MFFSLLFSFINIYYSIVFFRSFLSSVVRYKLELLLYYKLSLSLFFISSHISRSQIANEENNFNSSEEKQPYCNIFVVVCKIRIKTVYK